MKLRSILFRDDQHLQACLVHDQAHVKQGAKGDPVSKIQSALVVLDQSRIDVSELRENCYGPSTAAAVLAFKRKRQIINYSYQTHADDIVGKMTIAAMDREMQAIEQSWARNVFPRPKSR
jgi:peptidoglycan hydrolase-like protein with peptidoglycan-binding domain